MTTAHLETIINLLMLLGFLGVLGVWWASKRGGIRGRIAERALQAGLSQRNENLIDDDDQSKADLSTRLMRRLARFGEKIPFFDAKYQEKLRLEMVRGGYRSKQSVSILLAAKFFCGLSCAASTVMLSSHIPMIGNRPLARGALMLFMFMVGMIIPELIFSIRAARRRRAMEGSLSDALDLLVICTNAGNSLPVSIRRVGNELALICPPLSSEFSLTADELQLSSDSTRALHALAERIDLPSIRALISTLTQSMRYGTPITQALRTLARTERLAHIVLLEEKAAKLAPKMVVPMMLFILPAVIAISGGPAVIKIIDFMAKR